MNLMMVLIVSVVDGSFGLIVNAICLVAFWGFMQICSRALWGSGVRLILQQLSLSTFLIVNFWSKLPRIVSWSWS